MLVFNSVVYIISGPKVVGEAGMNDSQLSGKRRKYLFSLEVDGACSDLIINL